VLLSFLLSACVEQLPERPQERDLPPAEGAPSIAAAPESRVPVALAAHVTRPPLDLTSHIAHELAAGRIANWSGLGQVAAPLRVVLGPSAGELALPDATRDLRGTRVSTDQEAISLVEQDPRVIGVVSADALRASVQAFRVDGRHPIRQPQGYALTVPGNPSGHVVTATFVGDLMLGRRVGQAMASSGDFSAPFAHVASKLASADLTVGNLESTLSRDGRPRQGADSFAADPRVLEGIKEAGIDVVSLANNHSGDFGPAALVQTVQRLKEGGLMTVGAGRDAAEAETPVVVTRQGARFGFLAFNAIGETPRAAQTTPGAVEIRMQPRLGPLRRPDLDAFIALQRALRPQVDLLVVLPHWGDQYTTDVHEDQRIVARSLVEAGADLVIGSHSHWVGGAEIHKGKLIVYSLGNFVFDMQSSRQTREGAALSLTFSGPHLMAAEFLPVLIGRDFAPRWLEWTEGRPVLERIWGASRPPLALTG
jgi:poly-gamma-glutamate capsule biosynthesis protein CapA/YwtB (metallophosphatase superfamily)